MTSPITREPYEMFEDKLYEDWQEWKDGDDSALYDSGYHDGIDKCIEILKNVAAQPELNKLPSSFTVSVVLATLDKVRRGED